MVNKNLFLVIIHALVSCSTSKTSKGSPCHPNPCGAGTCVEIGDSYTCICPADGFSYTDNCVTENCLEKPCKNDGVCVPLSGKTNYKCICLDDFNGTNCEIDTRLCHPNPCKNGFPCLIKDGKEMCKCQLPYKGDSCEIGPCTNNPCHNGGTCTMYSKVPKCDCLPGFYGEICEKDVCYLRDVCKNGGTCRPEGVNKFRCECRPDYYGIFCENEILSSPKTTEQERITVTNSPDTTDEYISFKPKILTTSTYSTHELTEATNPTITDVSIKTTYSNCDCGRHSLSCEFNHEGDKICSCQAGFSQLHDVCVDCYCGENSANCSYERNLEKKCFCNKGYDQNHGVCKKTCSYDIDCLNGGICKLNGSDGFCECHADYSGDRCEINNACTHLEHICGEHGGICVIHEGLPQCECPPDKEYKEGVCKTICDASKCVHGECEIFGHSFKCRCFDGYTGKHCDKKSLDEPVDGKLIVVIFAIIILMSAVAVIGIVCWLTFISMKNKMFTQDPEKANLI